MTRKRSKVLLVDDDTATRLGLAEFFTEAGYEVQAVGSFEEGMRALRSGSPDFLIADVRLGARAGQSVRIATPGGEGTYRVSGLVAGAGSRRVLFFAADTAARLSGAPDHVRAVGVLAAPGVTAEQLQTLLGPSLEVLGRDHAADADAGDPTGDRAALVLPARIFADEDYLLIVAGVNESGERRDLAEFYFNSVRK